MRVTRSGKRKRGISTFIATLLLMVLAVAAGVIIYAYVMGYLGNFSMTVPQGNIQVQSVVQNPGNPDELWVYVQNLGKGSVKVDPASTSVYVDGSPKVGVSADPQTLNEGQTSLIKVPIPGVIPSTTITIKIVTADGLFAQTEYKVASATVVAGPLTAPTVAPTPAVVNQGQTSSLGCTVTTTGGTTPYTYQWLQKAPGDTTYSTISGATLSSYGFVTTTSTTTGDWSFELRVTDSVPNVVTSAPITVTVNSGSASNPSVSLAPTTWTMDVGQSKPFTATASGGSGTYTSYAWYVNTVVQSGQTTFTFPYSPASSGSFSITVTVTDSLGHTSPTSTPASVTVGSILVAPTVTAAPIAVNQGGTSSLTSAAMTTGSSPYTYQWLQEGPSDTAYSPISGATSSSYDFVTTGSTDTGAWSFKLQVTDGAGIMVTSAQTTITVNTGVAVSILPTTSTIDVGQSQLFTSSVTGGIGTPSYQWYLNDTSVSGQTASTYTFTPSTKGTSTIYVKVTDSSIPPVTVQSNTATVTTNYALVAPTVTATPTTIGQGQTSSLTSTPVTTGTSTYTYQWLQKSPTSGTYTAIVGETSPSYNFATTGSTTIGVWGFELRVTDSVGVIVISAPAMVTLNNGLIAPTVTATPSTIYQDQTSSLTSTTVTTGTSPYTYQWFQKGPSDIDYSPIVGETTPSYSFVTTTSTTVGSWSFELQVTDSALAVVTSTPVTVMVNPEQVLAKFSFGTITGTKTAGTGFSVTITAQDASGVTVTSFSGSVGLSASLGTISPTSTGSSGWSNGVWTGTVTLYIAGSGITIIANDGGGHTGTSGAINVNPGPCVSLTVTGFPNPTTVGTSGSVTVTAKDAYGNTATTYTGRVRITSSDGAATLPSSHTFTTSENGVHVYSVTLNTVGTQSITATDTSTSSITGSQTGIVVNIGAFVGFTITGYPTTVTAGTSFGSSNVVVTAVDSVGNTVTSYTGSVYFTSTDTQAVLPYTSSSMYTFTASDNGVHSFAGSGFTLKTAGSRRITVTTGTISQQSNTITVNPGALASFTMTGYPTTAYTGTNFGSSSVVVTAYDAYGNVATNYRGQVYFTSTDGLATLPYTSGSKYTFTSGDNGVHTFAGSGFTLNTVGSMTITVTDGIISLTSNTITVTAVSQLTLYPNGVGSDGITSVTPTGTAHWVATSDNAAADGTAYVYISSSSNQYTDYYAMQDHGSVTGTIVSVTAYIRCEYSTGGSGTPQAWTYIRLGTNTNTGTAWNLPSSWTTHSDVLTRPGGGSWSWTDIDNLQAGVVLNRTSGSTVACTLVYIVVTYTTP